MKLSIEQALQQGVSAHKEGRLQEAERLYRAILKSKPTHPDANHNLGLLLVSANKFDSAQPFFKNALVANPKIEQFWLSYIVVLIKGQQVEKAKQVLEQAKKQGIDVDRLNYLTTQLCSKVKKRNSASLSPSKKQLNDLLEIYRAGKFREAEKLAESISREFPEHQFAWKILGVVLKATGKVAASLVPSQKSVELAPLDAEAHNNLGVTLKELGRLVEAEASYKQAIVLNLDYAEAYSNLGVTLKELKRLQESETSCRRAIELKPSYAEAHNNLGSTLKELGRLEEAEASYNDAIASKPNLAEAHTNLGVTLKELGRLEEAKASCEHAIALKPSYAGAHNNLGNTLKELGRLNEALPYYMQAIALKPDFSDAYVNLSQTIKNVRFNSSNPKFYPQLLQLLTNGNFTRPSNVAGCILSLLKHDPLIKDLLHKKSFALSLAEGTSIITSLHKLPLLHYLMRVCPLPDLEFEGFFVTIRRFLLVNLDKLKTSSEITYFLSTLSLQCFVNEYVYPESDEEVRLVEQLEDKLAHTIKQSEQPKALKILCLASYRPLHKYNWCRKLEVLDQLKEVQSRLVEEPYAEKELAADIPLLKEISDDVSRRVRAQYEESPYPRWVNIGIPSKGKSISEVFAKSNFHLYSESITSVTLPAILVAGCGTGQHSLETASFFSGCHVTAVDLSLASLAYAKRKSNELGFTNLEYLQADILDLHQIGREFDIIESGGVLHHMDEPMSGWKVLTDILRPGGLMKIGLYSELARHHVVEVRKEIKLKNVGTSEADIREFRKTLAKSNDENHQLLITSSDFFSLSTLRDLVFHVQERRFTPRQIKDCLDELGLMFCGFENKDAISSFREFHGEKADIYDLTLWHKYEESNPRAFIGMYQFWCQKL